MAYPENRDNVQKWADGTRGRGRHCQARKFPCGGRRSGRVADSNRQCCGQSREPPWRSPLNRTTRNVALTSAGREYVEAIAPALSDIRNAAHAVADHSRKPTGTLRFSCSLAGGRQLLMPFVFEYLRRYTEMKVEIVTQRRLIDIITDGFDAGVRLAEAVPQDMIAVPLGPDTRHVVVGAPSYFANKSRPTAPADPMDHECIRARYSSGALYSWEIERHGEVLRIDVPGSLTLDEPEMIAQASRAGLGLAYVGER